MEEVVSLDGFYNKLKCLTISDVSNNDNTNSDIFETIEKEFGRTLSPTEYEIIKAWLDDNYSEELIKEALKEAIYNGVSNLRYIDKILYAWNRKGIKNKGDVEKSRKMHKDKSDDDVVIDTDIIDWDWLDEEE